MCLSEAVDILKKDKEATELVIALGKGAYMDYNWWDDRTVEESDKETNHPCYGCIDFMDGECLSQGACGSAHKDE